MEEFNIAAEENSHNLLTSFRNAFCYEDFLYDQDLIIPIFPVSLPMDCQVLSVGYDLDGVVIELNDVRAVVPNINYLFLKNLNMPQLKNHWSFLKKHIRLEKYSQKGLSALRKSFGCSLAYVDGGYFLNITCLPSDYRKPGAIDGSEAAVKAKALAMINALYNDFGKRLRDLPPEDLKRPSVMKTNLTNIGKMAVLPQDQNFIMDEFMKSYLEVDREDDMYMSFWLVKLGQKDPKSLDVASLVREEGVYSISVHAALTASPRDSNVHVMWSRQGLRSIVGSRGTMFSTYSFTEAANYQSNLDNKPMDFADELKFICCGQEGSVCTFVQLYNTTPHFIDPEFVRHPVSRVITTCGLHDGRHSRAIVQKAQSYVNIMSDLSRKSLCPSDIRVEGVFRFKGRIPEVINAKQFFNEDSFFMVLSRFPMLVPFRDDEEGNGVYDVVHSVSGYLCETLGQKLRERQALGGYTDTWTAFQFELALEELFFGRCIHYPSRPYSVSLGACSVDYNSVTYHRGFLGLAPVGSASVGTDPPPLTTWFKDELQIQRVMRVFPLTDMLGSSPAVVGDGLVKVLLGDLYKRNERLPVAMLKGRDVPFGKLVGFRSIEEFAKDLVKTKGFGYPNTFTRAVEMVVNAGVDVHRSLEMGLSGFRYFPRIKYWDASRHAKASCNLGEYIELVEPKKVPSIEARAAAINGDVLASIEERELCFSSKLNKYRGVMLPWTETCLRRLPEDLSPEQGVLVLTFLSCLALIQNGDFVEFVRMKNLMSEMSISQLRLQQLQLLSPLILIHSPRLYRLHASVPYQVKAQAKPMQKPAPKTQPEAQSKRPREDSAEEEEDDLEEPPEQVITFIEPKTLSMSMGRSWSYLESLTISYNRSLSHEAAYRLYLKACKDGGFKARSFAAFKRKRQRGFVERGEGLGCYVLLE